MNCEDRVGKESNTLNREEEVHRVHPDPPVVSKFTIDIHRNCWMIQEHNKVIASE